MESVIQKLKEIGYQVDLRGNDILLSYTGEGEPDPEAVNPLLRELKNRKPEALAFLRLQEETRKALEQLGQCGFIKVWSTKLQRTVYFMRKTEDRANLPIDAVAFDFFELQELTARRATPEELQKICNERDLTIPPWGEVIP